MPETGETMSGKELEPNGIARLCVAENIDADGLKSLLVKWTFTHPV